MRPAFLILASIAWFFVGVVPYFTARWFVLRREGTRYVAPAVTFILLLIASAALWITLLGPRASNQMAGLLGEKARGFHEPARALGGR